MPEQGNKDLGPGPLETAGQNVFAAGRFGAIWIAWVPEGVVMVELSGEPPPEEVRRRWLPELDAIPERALPRVIYEGLARYFEGAPVDPASLPVRLGGTKFQRRAWRALREVPRGSVRTYAGLAADAGSPRSMRAIGMAMGANPIPLIVPCHRCVAAGYALGGFSGGLDKKRFLLELEGVRVENDHVHPGQLELL
ncbi:MAG: methylated-DNA--[protein]-cysteine S-methyltransferase [Sandaracinaceae bacterium]|nr:methylated-DNA--[protein]-cysteine S-methyltransferase [Sandaracinaceae bacterium]